MKSNRFRVKWSLTARLDALLNVRGSSATAERWKQNCRQANLENRGQVLQWCRDKSFLLSNAAANYAIRWNLTSIQKKRSERCQRNPAGLQWSSTEQLLLSLGVEHRSLVQVETIMIYVVLPKKKKTAANAATFPSFIEGLFPYGHVNHSTLKFFFFPSIVGGSYTTADGVSKRASTRSTQMLGCILQQVTGV